MEQQLVMDVLKISLLQPPTLITLDYSLGAGKIILVVDSSLKRWGVTLVLNNNKYRHPSRYESGF